MFILTITLKATESGRREAALLETEFGKPVTHSDLANHSITLLWVDAADWQVSDAADRVSMNRDVYIKILIDVTSEEPEDGSQRL